MVSMDVLARAARAKGATAYGRRADIGMPLRDSEAIVLGSFALGDADRVVSVLTRSFGRLKGVAKGARKPKSAFGSALEPLSYVRLWFYERETRELVRLRQCDLLESFLEVQQDYRCGLALAMLADITEAVLPEREPSDTAFRLLLLAARTIKQTREPEVPLQYFSLWTVRLAGWLPDLNRCARCGREAGVETMYGAPISQGLACGRCRRPGMRALAPRSLATARRMLTERLEPRTNFGAGFEAAKDLQEHLLDMIEHNCEHKLATRRLLEAEP